MFKKKKVDIKPRRIAALLLVTFPMTIDTPMYKGFEFAYKNSSCEKTSVH